MGRQSRSATRGQQGNGCPEGVEFPSLSMVQPPSGLGSSIGHSHGFRLALHPWLFTLIPFGDAVKA